MLFIYAIRSTWIAYFVVVLCVEVFKWMMCSSCLQPKLVINNIEVLKHATINDEFSVSGPLYHDSLIWRIIALGANERCLPVILLTSDR